MSLEDRIVELRRNGDFSACTIRPSEGGFQLVLRNDGDSQDAERVLTDENGEEVLFGNVAEARATAYHCGLKVEEIREPR